MEREIVKHVSYINDEKNWREEFEFTIPVHVRFSETDMFGHMNNTIPFIYFEEARIAFLKHHQVFSDLQHESHVMPVVADLQCDFHQQVYFDEKLKLFVKVDQIGRTSCDLHYLATKENGTLAFTGRGRMVQISTDTGEPYPWTHEVQHRLDASRVQIECS
ncbi:thioesterase family protein [Thalassobacillus sp. CUG 92003]|uniref:acyl-CoA thioesterase n=1 Tax=Thalassobacillus sp. CUG 92003 TaxID=2736641 RepID=UPI0015E73B13|nr:thioesterase family protein [Thalassobacillus sp. CUG 92003]